MNKQWQYTTPGIPDHLFVRGKVPMTKEEIRVITLAKARLGPCMVVWDLGSGTGSISVEAAMMVPEGQVFAVEKSLEGVALTKDNAVRFALNNIVSVAGEAPDVLLDLPRPHRIIVGGSGGKLKEILGVAEEKLLPGGRMVINAVTLDTLEKAINCLHTPWTTDIVQVTMARSEMVGHSHLLRGTNPVFIITAWREEEKHEG